MVNRLKALAIIAVVLIHFNSHPFYPPNIYLDQISRFAVPLFVALSGYGLAKKYLTTPLNLVDFYRRRVTNLLPWYLLLALFFHFWIRAYPGQPLWKILLFGRADYQLYFVPMIFQFYLLFPLLFFLVKKFPRPVVFLSLVWQVFFYFLIGLKTENPANANRFWTDQQQYVLSITWIFYFVLGIYWASKDKPSPVSLALMALTGLAWSIISTGIMVGNDINLIIATRFTRLPVILYATGLIGLGIFYGEKLFFWLPEYFGKISYLTFLSHTIVLRFLFDFLGWQKFLSAPLFALVAIASSFFFAAILSQTAILFKRMLKCFHEF